MFESDLPQEVKDKVEQSPMVFPTGLFCSAARINMTVEDEDTKEQKTIEFQGMRLTFIEQMDEEEPRYLSINLLPETAIQVMVQLGYSISVVHDMLKYEHEFQQFDGKPDASTT